MDTGARLWGPTASQTALDYYGNPSSGLIRWSDCLRQPLQQLESEEYSTAMIRQTGKLMWTYGNGGTGNSTNAGYYNAYGEYPTFINAIGNGVIYTVTTEHTVDNTDLQGCISTRY